jgi:hypothetical protein
VAIQEQGWLGKGSGVRVARWLGEGEDGWVRVRVARPGQQRKSNQARVDCGYMRAVCMSGWARAVTA